MCIDSNDLNNCDDVKPRQAGGKKILYNICDKYDIDYKPRDTITKLKERIKYFHENGESLPVKSGNRKNCEYNGYELLMCVYILFKTSKVTREKLLKHKKFKYDTNSIEEYWKNYDAIHDTVKKEWCKAFKLDTSNVKYVYLTGKSYKTFPELVTLNTGLKQFETKADIYIETTDDTWMGLSIKQDKKCTKSNLSIFNGNLDSYRLIWKNIDAIYTEIFLKRKKNRNHLNTKLYDPTHPVMMYIRKWIDTNTNNCIDRLVDGLFCKNVPYLMYEYNGSMLEWLNPSIKSDHVLIETDEWQTDKNAKLFYILSIRDKKFKVEVRWKGNFNHSPQFHTHPYRSS